MNEEKNEQTVGKAEPELKLNLITVVWIIIGVVVSWFNMLLIYNTLQVWAYLSIIFTIIIPGIIVGYINRYSGYAYMLGFMFAGIPFVFIVDLFIGWYTFFTGLFIFIILWLIFWKTWRSISSIKSINE